MEQHPVHSSLLRMVGFDRASGVLELEFTNGHVYRYFDVSEFVHRALMLSASKGAFFHTQIESRYRFEQIR